jgi:predicted RND superfamily exporter protein
VKNGEFRIKIAIIAAIITFMGLFGSYKLYMIYNVEKPLEQSIRTISGVKQVSLSRKGQGKYEIKIKLDRVDNIQEKYTQIESLTEKKLRAAAYEIQIEDNRDTKLRKFSNYAQLALYQAGEKNEYLWLNQTLQEKAKDAGISCTLLVDGQRVYIQADDGTSYMYIIMPHNTTETAPEGVRT